MKLKCTQENLSKALSVVNKAVSVKASLPILSNILFTAKDGVFTLSTSNLETSIQTSVHASVEEEGSVAVPAKLFSEYVTSLLPGNLEIVKAGNSIKVVGAGSNAKFSVLPAEDFPSVPEVTGGSNLEIDPKELSSAVVSCAFCAAVGDSRPALTGVLLRKVASTLTVVATDGFRLSESVLTLTDTYGEAPDFNLLVPSKTLAEVARMFVASQESVKLTYSDTDNLAVFENEQISVAVRVLDGEFPDYKRIIPVNHILEAKTKTSDLVQAIKIAGVFAKDAKEGNNLIKLSIDLSGECSVASTSAQSGEGLATFNMEVSGEERLVLAFNSKYLMDFFNNVKTDTVSLFSNGESYPCLFKSAEMENFLHLIMPVKVNS